MKHKIGRPSKPDNLKQKRITFRMPGYMIEILKSRKNYNKLVKFLIINGDLEIKNAVYKNQDYDMINILFKTTDEIKKGE